MNDFDARTADVRTPQTNLIEASAGTGKTFGIAALFTRLVLQGVPVEKILVVTFTEAATAELKTRLRGRLGEAAACLRALDEAPADAEAEQGPPDALLTDLLQEALAGRSREEVAALLRAALSGFDTAAIYTIHGFCLRVLSDYAFLCGAPFEPEIGDHDGHKQLLAAQDFWREQVANHPQHARLAVDHRLTPDSVLQEIRFYLKRPLLDATPPPDKWPAAKEAWEQAWQQLAAQLPRLEDKFWQLHPQLNGNKFNQKTFTQLFAELAQAVVEERTPDKLSKPEKLLQFEAGYLNEWVKKGQQLDAQAVAELQPLVTFGRCLDEWKAAATDALVRLKLLCLQEVNRRLAADKRRSSERDFDDLLLDVYQALTSGSQAGELAAALAAKWQVALIDEFQDTDPLQYTIFKTALADRGLPVFLVGDPKQAIYGFRGADIHAYLDAAADAGRHYTLTTNYRSSRGVVAGIGHWFSRRSRPFVLAHIPYVAVTAARAESALQPLAAAVAVRWINPPAEAGGKLPNKELLRERAAVFCAREVADRLNRAAAGRLNLDGRPLEPKHIAVLVRTHNEAALVGRALREHGVQSVLLQQQSVFDTEEARAMGALLSFCLYPKHTETLRFLLGSVFYDQTAAELAALNDDEQQLGDWMAQAEAAADLWRQHGVYAALAHFARETGLERHLLAIRNERSLTNFWHLAELLAQAAAGLPAPEALPEWLAAQAGQGGGQDRQLRLESDENLVKIVTMHAAKGLEYPLVFCPFVWDTPGGRSQPWAVLNQGNGRSRLLAASQLEEPHQRQLFEEDLGERLRLLYVALTRAREELVVYAAACSSTPDNTFAYLLADQADDCHAIRAYWNGLKDQQLATALSEAWQAMLEPAPAGCRYAWLTDEPAEAYYRPGNPLQGHYRACVWPSRPMQMLRHTSFTGLTRQAGVAEEGLPESDWQEHQSAADTAAEPETPLLAFPKGARAGVCLHSLLEQTNFARPAAEQAEGYAALLAAHGYAADSHLGAATDMVEAARLAELCPGSRLADIDAAGLLPETGFVLHIKDFSRSRLQQWFARHDTGLPEQAAGRLAQLDFAAVNGFLNGFIDLLARDGDGRVFVIDYKSNHLGNRLADYHTAAMSAAVSEHHYTLQALIYAVATARYLKQRHALPDTIHVRYLFLRGLNPHGEEGIWRWDIPTASLAEWLDI